MEVISHPSHDTSEDHLSSPACLEPAVTFVVMPLIPHSYSSPELAQGTWPSKLPQTDFYLRFLFLQRAKTEGIKIHTEKMGVGGVVTEEGWQAASRAQHGLPMF